MQTGHVNDFQSKVCGEVFSIQKLFQLSIFLNELKTSLHTCSLLEINNGSCSAYINTALNKSEDCKFIEKCPQNELVFDRSIVKTSVTEDLDMTCDELYLRSIFNSLFLGGMLLGSFSIGMISDRFGRVKALVLSVFLTASSGLLGENYFKKNSVTNQPSVNNNSIFSLILS